MPYALVKPAGDSGLRLTLATELNWDVQSEALVEIEYEYAGASDSHIDGRIFDQNHSHGGTNLNLRRYVRNGSNITLSQTLTTSVLDYDHLIWSYDEIADNGVLTINGIVEHNGTRQVTKGAFIIAGFFAYANSGNTSAQSFKYFKVSRGGVLVHHWINTTGTGSVWTDIIGGNDATLVGTWPVDDSQWVFYSDGPATPTLTLPNATLITATSATPNVKIEF